MFNSPKPLHVPPQHMYTTLDELDYLRGLMQRGRLDLLRAALRIAPERRWYGDGMNVDAALVIHTLREMIAELSASAAVLSESDGRGGK